MRGQYEVTIPLVQVPTTEGSIAGIIVPANTVIELNRVRLSGPGVTANNNVRLRIRQFTGNTPTLSNAVTAKAVDQGNAIAAATTFGGKGAAGSGSVWSATPTTVAEALLDRGQNLYGGVIEWMSTLQESRRLGGASASYYDIQGTAGTQFDGALVLVFTE